MSLIKLKTGVIKVFRSSWTITIFSTMIGVFAGIYLNGLFKESSQNTQTQIAIGKIQQEITSNEQIIVESYKENQRFFAITKFIFENLDAEEDLILTSKEMSEFRLTGGSNRFLNSVYLRITINFKNYNNINYGTFEN